MTSLPSGWAWATLGDIAEVVGGVTKDSRKQSDPSYVEVPYLRVANVQRGYLDLSKVSTIRVPPAKAKRLALCSGDVLLNEGGDRDKLGRGWIWRGEIPLCIHQNHVFRARLHANILDPRLLAWYTNEVAHKWFEANASQTVNLASISLTKIKQLPVPIPPLTEQRRIVFALDSHISRIDQSLELLDAARRRGERLRRALFTEAFVGRLVEQDPGDDSAVDPLVLAGTEQGNGETARTDRPRKTSIRSPRQAAVIDAGTFEQGELPL